MMKADVENIPEQIAVYLVTDSQFASDYVTQGCKYVDDLDRLSIKKTYQWLFSWI